VFKWPICSERSQRQRLQTIGSVGLRRLVPRQYQGGETDQRGRISKRGQALLRKLLVEVYLVLVALQQLGAVGVATVDA